VSNVYVLNHPLIQHKLTYIRNRNTGTKEFRELVDEVATLMAYEITRDMSLKDIQIQTPMTSAQCKVLAGKKLGLVPILRAGLGMVEGILKLIPTAKVGHIGLYRDPVTLKPVKYYSKMPTDMGERDLIVIDPMLATGGSASEAILALKDLGGKNIKLMCLIAAPEGIKRVQQDNPDVDIYVAAIDDRLNEKCYIIPGLGDAGDRLFGTK
jgi:uracil phosphoribosyltransferase